MPISPLLCLKFVNYQHCWQKANKFRLFGSTAVWGWLARVLLAVALPLLGETSPLTCCIGEHGGSKSGPWGPGTDGMKGECKRAEGLVEGAAADVSTAAHRGVCFYTERCHVLQGARNLVLDRSFSIYLFVNSQALPQATSPCSDGSLRRLIDDCSRYLKQFSTLAWGPM